MSEQLYAFVNDKRLSADRQCEIGVVYDVFELLSIEDIVWSDFSARILSNRNEFIPKENFKKLVYLINESLHNEMKSLTKKKNETNVFLWSRSIIYLMQ